MENTTRIEALIRELDSQRVAYLDTVSRVHELLAQNLAATLPRDTLRTGTPPTTVQPEARSHRSHRSQRSQGGPTSAPAYDSELASPPRASPFPSLGTWSSSRSTGDESDSDDGDEALHVQTPLETQTFDMESMRTHLKMYPWNRHGREILEGVVGNPDRLSETPLVPNRRGRLSDRSDHTHYQVYDVGIDGCPLPVDFSHIEKDFGKAMGLWHAIKEINPVGKERKAVGRITIVREPSPILLGAIHYTMNKTFDVSELFSHLYSAETSAASLDRAFENDPRRQRSCVFNFEYFTIIGKDCEPAKWQLAARQEDRKPHHISITRCSSVIALVLNGDKIRDVKSRARGSGDRGAVYDPWSSWQVLNIQCSPDLKASLDVHDPAKHYVNGPEAFMTTILGEYRDAYRRLSDITKRISKRVRPPLEFMFDADLRDKLLFEDDDYSRVRRYHWAHQTLGIMNESIKAILEAYEDNFTDEVWEGRHRILWPLLDQSSGRNVHYKKKMAGLRLEFDGILRRLRRLLAENNERRKEIQDLREDLFTGTSIQESRKSVNATETTVQQGHNIKLLTLVNMFFLPLTFVTSVFGMENIFRRKDLWMFAVVTVTVCVPFFLLIGSLNSRRGLHFWKRKTSAAWNGMLSVFGWVTRKPKDTDSPDLLSMKSFDSQGRTATNLVRMRRYSSMQNENERKVARGAVVSDEPESRDERVKVVENGRLSTSAPRSPALRPMFKGERIAGMLVDERERRRRLTYSEDV